MIYRFYIEGTSHYIHEGCFKNKKDATSFIPSVIGHEIAMIKCNIGDYKDIIRKEKMVISACKQTIDENKSNLKSFPELRYNNFLWFRLLKEQSILLLSQIDSEKYSIIANRNRINKAEKNIKVGLKDIKWEKKQLETAKKLSIIIERVDICH